MVRAELTVLSRGALAGRVDRERHRLRGQPGQRAVVRRGARPPLTRAPEAEPRPDPTAGVR